MDGRPSATLWRNVVPTVTSPAFTMPLLVLLLNDFVLKRAFGNAVTGKLSDVAGLWLFPAFFAAFMPRYRAALYALTAVGFSVWKSPLSGPAIDSWKSLPLMNVERVVDWTDLAALIILVPSYFWARRSRQAGTIRAVLAVPVTGLALFAFTATSYSPDVVREETFDPDEQTYTFNAPKSVVLERLNTIEGLEDRYPEPPTPFFSYTYTIEIPGVDGCDDGFEGLHFLADFVDTLPNQSEVRLRKAFLECDKNFGEIELRMIFEREIIARLRRD